MKRIILKRMTIRNFKGCGYRNIEFGRLTNIYGPNASGKTTIEDALTWVLFGRDSSGATNFAVRPVSVHGRTIDNVDIEVTVVLEVDGVEIALKKVQKQNWVKKRGSETPALQGNVNTYEVDGFPANEKEFKAKVAEIISEGMFELMTDPRRFAAMPWKDQRNVLTRFLDGVTDEGILAQEKYEPIRDELAKAPLEKCTEKAKKQMAELKDRQKELPTRADEAGRSVREVDDKAVLDGRKAEIEKNLAAVRTQMASAEAALAPAQEKVMETRAAITRRKQELREAHEQVKHEARREYNNLHEDGEARRAQFTRIERMAGQRKEEALSLEGEIEKLTEQWREVRAWTLDESETVCDKCGQKYPEDRIEEIQEGFEKRKLDRLKGIEGRGAKGRKELEEAKQDAERLMDEAKALRAEWDEIVAKEGEAFQRMNALPQEADLSGDHELTELFEQLEEQEKHLEELGTDEGRKAELEKEERGILAQMEAVNADIAQCEANRRAKERMEELNAELRRVSQLVADQERIVCLLEEFTQERMEMLSGEINRHFERVRFKLFEKQLNGGIRNVCEMQLGGVTYSNLNSAGRTQAGLDVIKALQKLYDVSAPIWLDNRESVVEIPEMDAQIINMYVSASDRTLRVEVEE